MRSRATEAPVPAGPWESEFSDVVRTDVPFGSAGYLLAETGSVAEAKHIASWHPLVALAVADWLEATAEHVDRRWVSFGDAVGINALNVARAYLGGVS